MKYKKLIPLLVVTGVSIISAQTFASETTTSTTNMRPPMHGSGAVHGSGSEQRGDMISSYLRTDLTDDEKTTVQTLIKTYRDDAKALIEANGTGALSDTTKESLTTLKTTFVSNILTYIQTDKQTEFSTKFTSEEGFGGRNGRQSGSGSEMRPPEDASGSVSSTSETTTTKTTYKTSTQKKLEKVIDAKLATFSTDDEKTEWIDALITKIDTALEKITSASKKRTLNSIKTILEEKLDELSSDSDTDTSVDDILE